MFEMQVINQFDAFLLDRVLQIVSWCHRRFDVHPLLLRTATCICSAMLVICLMCASLHLPVISMSLVLLNGSLNLAGNLWRIRRLQSDMKQDWSQALFQKYMGYHLKAAPLGFLRVVILLCSGLIAGASVCNFGVQGVLHSSVVLFMLMLPIQTYCVDAAVPPPGTRQQKPAFLKSTPLPTA